MPTFPHPSKRASSEDRACEFLRSAPSFKKSPPTLPFLLSLPHYTRQVQLSHQLSIFNPPSESRARSYPVQANPLGQVPPIRLAAFANTNTQKAFTCQTFFVNKFSLLLLLAKLSQAHLAQWLPSITSPPD